MRQASTRKDAAILMTLGLICAAVTIGAVLGVFPFRSEDSVGQILTTIGGVTVASTFLFYGFNTWKSSS